MPPKGTWLPYALLKPCGTLTAYRRHSRRGEHPCRECKDAYNAARGKWREKEKKVTSKNASAYTVSPPCAGQHRPVKEVNRKKQVIWTCEVCGAFLCYWSPSLDTRRKVLEMKKK